MHKRTHNDEDIALLFFFAFIIITIVGIMANTYTALINWEEYIGLTRWVACIYFYIIVIPIKFIFSPWQYIYNNELTPYDNLNLVLAILNIGIYIIISIFIHNFIAGIGKKKSPLFTGGTVLNIIYFLPFIIWIFYLIIKWLFS